MDHGQLQVCLRIVERDTAGFGKHHEEKGERDQEHRSAAVNPRRRIEPVQLPGKREAPGQYDQKSGNAQECALRQRGKLNLAARPHSLEAGTGIQRPKNRGGGGESEQVNEQQNIPGKSKGGVVHAERQKKNASEQRRQRTERSKAQHMRGCGAVDASFPEQFPDVVI